MLSLDIVVKYLNKSIVQIVLITFLKYYYYFSYCGHV